MEFKAIRDNISVYDRKNKSQQIAQNLLALLESDFKGANIFLCFYPFGSEVDLLDFYNKLLKDGKELYFPISNVKSHTLHFKRIYEIDKDFHIGSYNIMEPDANLEDYIYTDSAVAITPGLVFDKSLNRLGYGAGYYDRFFESNPNIKRIGICYTEQITQEVPISKHDMPMNCIVTDNCIMKG